MKISEILNRKGRRVETIAPQATLAQANAVMTRLGIGAVVVHDLREGILGVLSERDILRSLAEEGPSALDVPVTEALRSRAVTCGPSDEVRAVMESMTHRRVRHVPVLVEGDLDGIVSMGDIIKQLLAEARLEVGVLRDYARSH